MITVTRLTKLNVDALHKARNLFPSDEPFSVTTAAAIFSSDSATVIKRLDSAIQTFNSLHGPNSHPAKSLQAVRRKVSKQAGAAA